jgi:hypothetical protein
VPVPITVVEQEEDVLAYRLAGLHLTKTETMVGGVVTVMFVEPDTVGDWMEVAVMVTVPEAGAVAGAV